MTATTTATARIAALQALLRHGGFDAALLHSAADVFYYTGTKQPANLLIPAGAVREPALFVRRARDFVEEDIRTSGFPRAWVADGQSFREVAARLAALGLAGGVLDTSEDKLPTSLYRSLARALPGWELRDLSALVLGQRMVKEPGEVELMRRACGLFAAGHEAILATARPGVSELEVSLAIFAALRLAGHEEYIPMRRWDAYLPPTGTFASGESLWRISGHAFTVTGVGISPAVPIGPSRRRLLPGDLIVYDVPTNYRGYFGDTARTYVVGKPSAEQRRAFDACVGVYRATIAALRPGITAEGQFAVARAAAGETPYAPYFMGYGDKQGAYIGHATGLEQDEPPVLSPRVTTPLRPGLTLAIEPKFIIPGFGAVDVEDTWLVTEDGCEVLHEQPNDLFVVG
jgi:Xaa-Pro dipeptidase